MNLNPNKIDHSLGVSSSLKYAPDVRPAHVVSSPPVHHSIMPPMSHPSMINSQLLAGHESFIICPGQKPVKVTHAQTVSYYWPGWLVRIRYNKNMLYHPLDAT